MTFGLMFLNDMTNLHPPSSLNVFELKLLNTTLLIIIIHVLLTKKFFNTL